MASNFVLQVSKKSHFHAQYHYEMELLNSSVKLFVIQSLISYPIDETLTAVDFIQNS